jgi:hypothetical protein
MKLPVLICFFCAVALCQTAAPAPPSPVETLNNLKLPAYIAGGGAFNQFAGVNLWGSAIIPVSNSVGLYESTTTDLFPVRVTAANGKIAYIFQASAREGVHKVISNDGKNMTLVGLDAGFSFAQASSVGGVSSGVSAAITFTYVRQISKTWALMVPVRALYMPTLGGWNPIVEFGVCWKPGAD